MINYKRIRELLTNSSVYSTALFLFEIANTQETLLEAWLRKEKSLHTEDDVLEYIEKLQCIE